MSHIRSLFVAVGTLACALAIGFFLQYGAPSSQAFEGASTINVTDINPTSSAGFMPKRSFPLLPIESLDQVNFPEARVELASASPLTLTQPVLPVQTAQPVPACNVTMTAAPAAAAMVEISLMASCLANERVTIHHSGMMFTATTETDGGLKLSVPALSERAVFVAAFGNGEGAVAQTTIPSLPFYDRVVVQWRGNVGLQLHAREFGADYWTEGHIWQAAAGDTVAATRGDGGFLTRLGQIDAPEALLAEVYSFPVGTSKQNGDIMLSVETEITTDNCANRVSAQTLELRDNEPLRVQDLLLEIPDCAAVGDFLVLKNMLEDLTIVSN